MRISFENYMKITPGYEEDAGGGEEGGKCLRKTKWGIFFEVSIEF